MDDHDQLVAYELETHNITETPIFTAKDQWGDHDFKIKWQAYLLVPTEKHKPLRLVKDKGLKGK